MSLEEWMKTTGWNREPVEGELVYEVRPCSYQGKTMRVIKRGENTYSGNNGIWLRIEETEYTSEFYARAFRPMFNGSGICIKCKSKCFTDKTESCPFFKEGGV